MTSSREKLDHLLESDHSSNGSLLSDLCDPFLKQGAAVLRRERYIPVAIFNA